MNKRFTLVFLLLTVALLAVVPLAQAQDETKVVSFFTTFGGSELDALNVSLAEFTNQTGILVTVESNRQSTEVPVSRVVARRMWHSFRAPVSWLNSPARAILCR
jgi:spermidine/putrescine-binding protein